MKKLNFTNLIGTPDRFHIVHLLADLGFRRELWIQCIFYQIYRQYPRN